MSCRLLHSEKLLKKQLPSSGKRAEHIYDYCEKNTVTLNLPQPANICSELTACSQQFTEINYSFLIAVSTIEVIFKPVILKSYSKWTKVALQLLIDNQLIPPLN